MSREEIFSRGKKIIMERLGVDEIQIVDNASFKDDLEADSLDVVELIMELEDEFNIEIPDEDAETFKTVGDVVSYIESKLLETV